MDQHITTLQALSFTTVSLCLVQGDQYTVVVKETDSNFDNVLGLGHYWKSTHWALTLRFQQLAVKCGTKTKDKVFVNIVVLIQYHALANKARETFYKPSNPRFQLQAYVFEVIRACVPKLNLDDAFEQKDDIAKIAEALKKAISAYGFKIVRMMIVDIEPDETVKRAMTVIIAAARLRMVTTERGKAGKILQPKRVKVEAVSKYQVNCETMKENRATSKSSAILVSRGPGVSIGEDSLVPKLTKAIWKAILAWAWTDGEIWSFYEAVMEHNWEDWTSVVAGVGEVATGQQQFLYFFYPP